MREGAPWSTSTYREVAVDGGGGEALGAIIDAVVDGSLNDPLEFLESIDLGH